MSKQGTKKQSDTQFVCKLIDMIQKYPKIINWNQQGQKIIIFNFKLMETLVLFKYFRHSKFESFIRQLNMYDFHKLYKKDLQIGFKNEFFKRGNEKNYHFIHRRKKVKEQTLLTKQFQKKTQSILKRLKLQTKLQSSTKQVIQSLLEYKYIAYENMKNIRQQLQSVIKQLGGCRSKKISETIKLIKNQLSQNINQQLNIHKQIDQIMENKFLTEKQNNIILVNQQNNQQQAFQMRLYEPSTIQTQKAFFEIQRLNSQPIFIQIPNPYEFFSINQLNNMHPVYISISTLHSQLGYTAQQLTKQQQENLQNDDDCSMEVVDPQLLEKNDQNNEDNNVKEINNNIKDIQSQKY